MVYVTSDIKRFYLAFKAIEIFFVFYFCVFTICTWNHSERDWWNFRRSNDRHNKQFEIRSCLPSAAAAFSLFFRCVSLAVVFSPSSLFLFSFPMTQDCFFGDRNSNTRTRITGTSPIRDNHMVDYDMYTDVVSVHAYFPIRLYHTQLCTRLQNQVNKMTSWK